MSPADLLIVAVLAISTVVAFVKGFFVEVFSLVGVVLGLLLAGAYYASLAQSFERWISNPEVANLSAFLLIALGVMLLAGILGRLIRGAVRTIGLGFVDRSLGAFFGFLKGCALVVLVLMGIAAFVPQQDWLKNSRLAPVFMTASHDASRITSVELGGKIREGIQLLRMNRLR